MTEWWQAAFGLGLVAIVLIKRFAPDLEAWKERRRIREEALDDLALIEEEDKK